MATPPTTKTEISFASAWNSFTPTWVDVTQYVRAIDINRGRAEDLNPFDSGTARIELDNRDGRFNPSNTVSPYYPNVKPRKQIQITSTYEVPTRTNLCPNPSFETNTTSWTGAACTPARITSAFYIGTACLRLTSASATDFLARVAYDPNTTIDAGVPISASAYIYNFAGNNRQHRIDIRCWNGVTLVSTIVGTATTINVGAGWTRLTVSGMTVATTDNIDAVIYMQLNNQSLSNVSYVDAVLIEQSSNINPYFDGNNSGCTWTGTVNNSTSVLTRTNLCANPSFESNSTGWGGYFSNALVRQAGTISGGAGDWSLVSSTYQTGAYGMYYTMPAFVVGDTFTASAYCLRTVGARSYRIAIEFFNGFVNISSAIGTAQNCNTSTRLSVTGTVPATTTIIYISIYATGVGAIGDAHQIDAVQVENTSTLGQYFDGSSSGVSYWTGTVDNSTSIEQTTPWPLFRGYIQTWPQEYPQYGLDATSTITAVDGLAILGGMKTPIDEMAARVSAGELPAPYARWKLGDTDATNPRYIDSSGNGRDLPATMDQFTGPPMAKYLDDASSVFAYGNGSLGFATNDFTTSYSISMWIQTTQTPAIGYSAMLFQAGRIGLNKVQVGVNPSGNVYVTGYDYNAGFIPYSESYVRVNDGQPHHICITSGSSSNKIYIDGYDKTTYNSTLIYTSQLFGTWSLALSLKNEAEQQYYGYMQDVCIWASSLSATQVNYVYGIGTGLSSRETTSARANRIINAVWPAAVKSIATGSGYCSTSEYNDNALNALQKIADTENGLFFVDRSGILTFRNRYYWQQVTEGMTSQATFGDDQGIDYETFGFRYDADQMANTFVINSGIGVPQTASDAATVTAYGSRTVTIDTLLSTVDALSMAQGLAAQYAEPVLRSEPFKVNMYSDINATRLLNLELGYKFTLRRNALGVSSPIVQNLSLDSVQHFIRPDSWTVTVDGSPRQQYSWFVLDSSLLDGPDELGY